MKTSDELMRRKIALFGMTLWMDPKGKKKTWDFIFPPAAKPMNKWKPWQIGEDRSKMSSSERAEFQRTMIQSLIQSAEIIELIGLADKPLTSSRSGITNGIQVAISTDEDGLTLTYEAIIPFKSYRLSKANLPVLGIGFETGKFVSKAKQVWQELLVPIRVIAHQVEALVCTVMEELMVVATVTRWVAAPWAGAQGTPQRAATIRWP